MARPDLIEQRKQELLSHIQNFYRTSWNWRSTRFHEKWDRIDRNYHSIYDPARKAEKEPWQSTMFVDLTLQNCEIIRCQLHKTMNAPNPPVQTEAGPAGDHLQAKLIQDILAYQMMKGHYSLASYDSLGEAVKYGSGFMKVFWDREVDTRMRRTPVEQSPEEVVAGAPPEALMGQAPMPSPMLKGFAITPQEVLIKNNIAYRYVHIRDIFPDPNTTTWDKVIHREKVAYGDIVRGIQQGVFFDVRDQIDNMIEGEKFESDVQSIKYDRGYFDANRSVAKFEKRHTIWELWSDLPRKWVEFDLDEGDAAEELVPAKAMCVSGVALLCAEINQKYDGDSPIIKYDYIRTGETYGKGIGEMLLDDQDEINEHENAGIDNMSLLMNKTIAVIEAALVNPEEDLISQPGGMVRLKAERVDDIRKAIMTIDFPDLAQSFFRHRFDIERTVQEKTGANRVTLGSSGVVKDTNQTLGGMEMLRQMFNERVAAYGMTIEVSALLKVAEKSYGLIYQELDRQELRPILGEQPITIGERLDPMTMQPVPVQVPRFMAFAFPPPEEIHQSYRFKPMGIFSLENKVVKVAQAMDAVKLLAGDPRFDVIGAMKYITVTLQQLDEFEKFFLDVPMVPLPPGMLPPGGDPNQGPPGAMGGKDTPGLKGGPNGNQPSFLPNGQVQRQAVPA